MPVFCEMKYEKSKNEYCYQNSFQNFSKFKVEAFVNNLCIKLQNMSLCAEKCEDVNKCWDEFQDIFSQTLFHHALIKISSKNNKCRS